IRPVAIHHVEDERPKGHLESKFVDVLLAASCGGLLKGDVLFRLRVVGDRLTVQNDALDHEPVGCGDELREHRRHRLEISGEDAHLILVLVNLDPEAVVLRLNAHHPKLLDHRLRIGKTLGQLGAERLANCDLERLDSALTFGPERPGNKAKVRGAVVGTLEYWSERAITSLCERKRVENGWVADP